MSIYMAPSPESALSGQKDKFRRFNFFLGARLILLLAVAIGVAICLLLPMLLPYSMIATLLLLLIAFFLAFEAKKIARKDGPALLDDLRKSPTQRSLMAILRRLQGTTVLVRPVLRLGHELYSFDLAAVSMEGITFFNSVAKLDPEDINNLYSNLKNVCSRLGEQYSLPLLSRIRIINLTSSEILPSSDNIIYTNLRDIGKYFQKVERSTNIEDISRSLRALYNLCLSSSLPPIPIGGKLPAFDRFFLLKEKKRITIKSTFVAFGKIIMFCILLVVLALVGVYLLQTYNYEIGDRILAPGRKVLREVISKEWQSRLRLGKEIVYDEDHVYAKNIQYIKLSDQIGLKKNGKIGIIAGTNLQIVQMGLYQGDEWYLVRTEANLVGWLPKDILEIRHLLIKGTPLYERPNINSLPAEYALTDLPIALINIWYRSSKEIWSKISFLDKKKIRFVKDKI